MRRLPDRQIVFAICLTVILTIVNATSVRAAEGAKYTYDALGRLTKIDQTSGPASGTNSTFTYDPAGNRSSAVVSGATFSGAASGGVIVIPLNGYIVIPLS